MIDYVFITFTVIFIFIVLATYNPVPVSCTCKYSKYMCCMFLDTTLRIANLFKLSIYNLYVLRSCLMYLFFTMRSLVDCIIVPIIKAYVSNWVPLCLHHFDRLLLVDGYSTVYLSRYLRGILSL